MLPEIEQRLGKCPRWLQDIIKRYDTRDELLIQECAALRKQVDNLQKTNRRLSDRIDAMTEIFEAANRGGHETAAAFVEYVMREHTQYDE